jgi:toxoflavin biosynthesis protein ToxD
MANKIVYDCELMERVGGGGFGLTFRAEHIHLRERVCAVKLVQAPYIQVFKDSGEALTLLTRAIDTAAESNSTAARHLVRTLSLRYDVEEPYVATEWAEGGSLAERVKQGPLSLDQIVQITIGILEALAFVHGQGFTHGNLKPTNVLLTRDGVPKLSDFGGYFRGEGLSPSAAAVPYLSPEQLEVTDEGAPPPDPSSDLYATTLLLYEMCTGRRVPRVLLGSQVPSRVNSRLSQAFDDLVNQGLAPEPASRFRDARSMQEAVLAAAGRGAAGTVVAAPPTVAEAVVTETPASPSEAVAEAAGEAPAPAAAPPALGEVRVNETDGAEMVWVSAGMLHMGSEDEENERPVHDVEMKGFWVYRCPVTQEQFWSFLMARTEPGQLPAGGMPQKFLKGAQYNKVPAAGIKWEEAVEYCKWAGVRLPTEAEWEWAARGPDGRKYPWGDSWDPSRANTMENGQMKQGEPLTGGGSWCGAQDMSGNVFEWCSTLLRPYPYDPDDGREDPKSAEPRVLRGGSATTGADMARSAYRCVPNYMTRLTGFRPVKEA